MVILRDGWNITADIANPIEMIGRYEFSFQDAALVNHTIFESACVAQTSFVESLILILRKVSNYQDIDEIQSFINSIKDCIGKSVMEIGNEKSYDIFTNFEELYEKYKV